MSQTPHKVNPSDYQVQEMIRESFNDTYKILESAQYVYRKDIDAFVPVNGVTTISDATKVGVVVVNPDGSSINASPLPTGTNIIGALLPNQSVNVAQINGVVPTTNNGISGTGVVRVTIASDSTGQVKLASGTNNIGSVGSILTGVNVGQTTSSTTAVQLTASSIIPSNGVLVQALKANIATVYIGDSSVTPTTGYELQAGQAVSFTPTNINVLYVIGANTTDKICWNVM